MWPAPPSPTHPSSATFRPAPLALLAAAALLAACSAELDSGGSYDFADSGFGDGGGGNFPDTGADLPPEEEEDFDFERPQASLNYVYVATPSLNSVARVDSITLDVTPIEVCLVPTDVATLTTRDRAVALCEGDDQVAVIDSTPSEDEVRYAGVAEGTNRLMLNPTGEFALVWFDVDQLENGQSPGNPQDLSVVALDGESGPQSWLLSVGFNIEAIQFDAEGRTAFLTTEDGLCVVALDEVEADGFVPVIGLGDDPLARAQDREVIVSDDGAFAFVRTSELAGLRLLDIATGDLTDIALPAVPTDLDVFPGGERAIAVLRDAQAVALLPLPQALTEPSSIQIVEIPEAVVGLAQLAQSGQVALLYSPAAGSSRLVRLDLDDFGRAVYELRKPITGVALSPDETRALVFQSRAAGSPEPGDPIGEFVAQTPGYTLFDLGSGFSRLVQAPTEPREVVYTESGEDAFALLADAAAGVRAVQWVHFDSFRVDTIPMERLPEAIGIVPATGRVWVSQLAESGRITFIDTTTGRLEHVTAFQLNRRIE